VEQSIVRRLLLLATLLCFIQTNSKQGLDIDQIPTPRLDDFGEKYYPPLLILPTSQLEDQIPGLICQPRATESPRIPHDCQSFIVDPSEKVGRIKWGIVVKS